MYVASYLPNVTQEETFVRSKWLQGSMMMPSLDVTTKGTGDRSTCWFDAYMCCFVVYLMMDFDQLIDSCNQQKVDKVRAKFQLAVKHESTKMLLSDSIRCDDFSGLLNVTEGNEIEWTVQQLRLKEKLDLPHRLFLFRINHQEEELQPFLNNPASFFRFAVELSWGDNTCSKPIFISQIFRLSTCHIVVDASSSLSSCNLFKASPKGSNVSSFLYTKKPWWHHGDIQLISKGKAVEWNVLHISRLIEKFANIALEDVDPIPVTQRSHLFRIRVASSYFDQLLEKTTKSSNDEDDDEFVELPTDVIEQAPIICPNGRPICIQDELWVHLLSSETLQPIPEVASKLQLVIDDLTVLSVRPEHPSSFCVPAKYWHALVPSVFHANQPGCGLHPQLANEDSEISLIVHLRVVDSLVALHRKECVLFFQMSWTNRYTKKKSFCDSFANRNLKIKFDYPFVKSQHEDDAEKPKEKLVRFANHFKENDDGQEFVQLAKDIRDVKQLRNKITELETQLTTTKKQRKREIQEVHSSSSAASSSISSLKEDLNKWIRIDERFAVQDESVSILKSVCCSIIDDFHDRSSWLQSRGVILPFKQREQENEDVLWDQAKQVLEAWMRACLQFMSSSYPGDDVEGMKMFLRESFSNNPNNPAYNAALEKCIQVQFPRFNDFCRKLRCKIEEML